MTRSIAWLVYTIRMERLFNMATIELGNRTTLNVSKSSDLMAAFTASPTSGPAPLTVAFTDQSTGSINSWSWYFSDGGTSTSQNPSHVFSSAGTYLAQLTVGNGTQYSSQSTYITVYSNGPAAAFNASPTSGVSPLAVQFTDSSTGNVTGWSWSFGDGGTSTSQNPSHTYASPGTYTASLTVAGPGGSSGPVNRTISVTAEMPGANFYATPASGVAPLTVSFTNNSTGIITAWSWAFGDGATSTSENPSHTYAFSGTYAANLTVTGPNGYSSTKSVPITVSPVIAPIANFTATPTSGAAPLSVSFTDSSTGTITAWSWNFGDGGTSTTRNPTYTYAASGTYTASLTVSGPAGQPSTSSISITTIPPAADFEANQTGATALTVQFTDTSTGSPTSWSWDFGDGSVSTTQSPSHTYSSPGAYTVSLTITSPAGSNTKIETVAVIQNPGLDQYTKLLLHLDGANDSTTFVDSESIPKNVAGYGNAQISTAYSVFGGASLMLDGNNSYLTVPPSPDWKLSGDFTIDFWWYRTGPVRSGNPLVNTAGSADSFLIEDYYGAVRLWISSNGTSWDIANQVQIGTASGVGFDHFAIVRSGNNYYAFQNGVLTSVFSSSLPPYYDASQTLNIGGPNLLPNCYYAIGYIDEFRVSNGVARWTANFTPPGAPYSSGPQPPTAGFTSNTTTGYAPLPVQFTDTSTGSVTSWSWDFGDGNTSTSQYPGHTYSSPGAYAVSLSVSGPEGSNTVTMTGYITVNAAPPGIDQYTKLMLHLDGANGSTTFADSEITPKTVTGYGNAQMSTSYSEFGGASLQLDGDGSYLSVPPSPDWDLSGDFTIDFWWDNPGWYHDSPIIATSGGSGRFSFLIEDMNGTVVLFISSNGSAWDIAAEVQIGTSTNWSFNHFALVRSGNTYYAFQNGVLTNVFLSSLSPYYVPSNSLNVGGPSPVTGDSYAMGNVDELRVSNGIARWTANFTPPTSEYYAYTITAYAGTGGSISPSGTVELDPGASRTFTITPNTGNVVASVLVDGSNVGAVTSYTFSNVTANHAISATFEANPNTYTVTPSAGTGGSISPSTPQTVNYGGTLSFTVTPNTGYGIGSVTGCGGTLSGNTFTTGPITGNCTVSATFAASTYAVTPSAGTGGSISPSTPQTVNYGETISFTVTPNIGNSISSVTGCGGTLSGNTFTTGPITGDCTVSAAFAAITCIVTPSAGTGGSISPSTPQTVNYDGTISFTVTPNTGYSIGSVTGCGGTLSGNTFTTGPITGNCAVSATFAASTYTVTPSAGTGGSISPSTPQTVNYGQTISFTVTPNPGNSIGSVTGCGGTLSGNTYTTGPITGDCTVSATFPTFGIDQYTKLILHMDGANGSTTFVDSEITPKTVTGYGDAQISTAHSEFGGASLMLDGNSSYLTVPPSADWNFSGDFTIDFWWYRTGPANSGNALINAAGGFPSFVIEDYYGAVRLWISSDGTYWDIANQVQIGTASGVGFDHFAIVRSGNNYYAFQNGVLTNTFSSSLSPYYDASNSLNIGHPNYLAYGSYAIGYIDEVRVSNGVARWTANFTPPSAPYSAGPQPPTAGFTSNTTSGYPPLLVQFTDTSTGSVTSWSWDFGDGNTSTSQYPSHTYSSPGAYTVSLSVSGPEGSNTATKAGYITVNAAPPGDDQYTKLLLHMDGANGSRTFVDSEITPKTVTGYGNVQISTAYSEFGGASLQLDGNNSYLTVPPSTDWNFSGDFTIDFWWDNPGYYHASPIIETVGGGHSFLIEDQNGTVYLCISSNGSAWDIAFEVQIGTSTNWSFNHFALVRSGNTYYTFQNGVLTNSFSSSLSPNYNPSNSLNIGGPSPVTGGSYAMGNVDELRVSNGIARWTSNFTPPRSPYSVGPSALTAGFTASNTVGYAPLPVQFTDTSTGSVTSWSWNFGDGNTSTSQYPSHTYSTPGTYTVSLSVSGPEGSNTATTTGYITVNAAPPGIDQYTKLMLHLDGANGSTTFVDSETTPKTVTGHGDAQISTSYSEFEGASLQLDGNGSYLSVPPSPDWDFSGDFTIDFWWYQTGWGYINPIIETVGGGYSIWIGCMNNGGTVGVSISSNGTTWGDIANQVPMGTPRGYGFYHYALVRSGNTYYTFQNGVLTNVFLSSLSPNYNTSNSINIGGPLSGYYATGYVDEVRISNGIARWTANFTPPTSEYTSP